MPATTVAMKMLLWWLEVCGGGIVHRMSKQPFPLAASATLPSTNQALFVRYFTATLVDLVVLNLFEEYWQHVVIGSFTISLAAAILLQLLLKLTLWLEHKVADYFTARPGAFSRFMRYFAAWLILFGSKFVMLEAISMAFGEAVYFGGPMHGVVSFIAVVVAMVVAEELVIRLYRRLA